MLVVDRNNAVEQLTVQATELLEDLRTSGVNEAGLPTILGAAVTRARLSRTSSQLVTRARGQSGRWLRITAAVMVAGTGSVAVMIEPARPSDLAPILLDSLGLTVREVEIVMMLTRGLATKQIATDMGLSAHTVRDHVKSIFEKTGVTSRGELAARMFSEHQLGTFERAVHRIGV